MMMIGIGLMMSLIPESILLKLFVNKYITVILLDEL